MDFILILIISLLIIFSIILVWINLPGNFIFLFFMFLFGYFSNFEIITQKILLISLLLYILFEIIEFLLSALTIKLYGGKNTSVFLSIIGGFLGAIIGNFVFPIIGGMIGLIMGAYITTYYNEKKNGKTSEEATQIANSTTLGYILSKGLKSIGILVLGIYLIINY